MATVKEKGAWRKWLPYLNLVIDLGPVGVRTAIMYKCYASLRVEYVALDWWMFKWRGMFGLYTTHKRIMERLEG